MFNSKRDKKKLAPSEPPCDPIPPKKRMCTFSTSAVRLKINRTSKKILPFSNLLVPAIKSIHWRHRLSVVRIVPVAVCAHPHIIGLEWSASYLDSISLHHSYSNRLKKLCVWSWLLRSDGVWACEHAVHRCWKDSDYLCLRRVCNQTH